MRLTRPLFIAPLVMTLAALFPACSAPGGGSAGSGNGASGGDGDGDGDGDIPIGPGFDVPDEPVTPPVSDDRDLPVREKVCDDSGQNCTCLKLALLGTLDSAANEKDTGPFIDWLNGNSDGTATVTLVDTKPAVLDAAWLSQYDIIISANINGWSFSDAEKAALAEWSKTTGGGVVSLTGFVSEDATEPGATSQLIDFSNISYSSTRSAEMGAQETPVKYDGEVVEKHCLRGGALITAAVEFTPQPDPLDLLTFELDYTGAYIGYAIDAPEDAAVIATDPTTGLPMAVAKEVDGAGRVFAWGDEWVIFANQWESDPLEEPIDPNNPCYKAAEGVEGEEGYTPADLHTVKTLYQTKQFWYNVINWVAPPNECGFTIEDEDVVPNVR